MIIHTNSYSSSNRHDHGKSRFSTKAMIRVAAENVGFVRSSEEEAPGPDPHPGRQPHPRPEPARQYPYGHRPRRWWENPHRQVDHKDY